MEHDVTGIQAFFVTASAHTVLGKSSLENAFDWSWKKRSLRRLTLREPDPDTLNAWCEACYYARAKPLLILGPEDRTPDFDCRPMLDAISVLTAHSIDSSDMSALRGILQEPDEFFTLEWEWFAKGHREWFIPPGPIGAESNDFWESYGRALTAYQGPVLGTPKREFDRATNEVWSASLHRKDLRLYGVMGEHGTRFALERFPFCGLSYESKSKRWSTEGWLPKNLEAVDPDGSIRARCESEISSHQISEPGGNRIKIALAKKVTSARALNTDLINLFQKLFTETQASVKLAASPLCDFIGNGLDAHNPSFAPTGSRSNALNERTAGHAHDRSISSTRIWSNMCWIPEEDTLLIQWHPDFGPPSKHLTSDGLVYAAIMTNEVLQPVHAWFNRKESGSIQWQEVHVNLADEIHVPFDRYQLTVWLVSEESPEVSRLALLLTKK